MQAKQVMRYVSVLLVSTVALSCTEEPQTGKEEIMDKQEITSLTTAQKVLVETWEEHTKAEFETQSTDETLRTMVAGAHVNHVPVLTGGVGLDEVGKFYSTHFIPQMPPDTKMTPVSRTVGNDQLVDELIFKFTHTIEMDWMLPGIAPTGKPVEVALVAIIGFRDGKVAHEHIYWDQASVLVQLGLLDPNILPVAGKESAQKVFDPTSVPSNRLIKRAHKNK